jgi:transcriptional regulator with XRE-family HTH domain
MDEAPNRIRELRLAAGMSQQALGDAVGISKMTISDLERGKIRLDLEYMRRIAQALNVATTDVLPADNPGALTPEERHWLDHFRAATPEQREQLQRVAEAVTPFGHTAYTPPPTKRWRRRA